MADENSTQNTQDPNPVQPTPQVQPAETPAQPASQAAPQAPQAQPAETPAQPAPQAVPQAPQAQTAVTPAQPTPQAQPAVTPAPQAAPQASASDCDCPEIKAEEWDKKTTQINKTFYKSWSPRLFYYPFSMAIDINRAIQGAKNSNLTVPENPMILDTGGMFWSSVMVEVTGSKEGDPNIVSLIGKNIYAKVSSRPWKEMKTDIDELKQELGVEPKELYLWYGACPKCVDKKTVKTVYLAVK